MKQRWIQGGFLLLGLMLASASVAHAAFSDSFDVLRDELVSRASALSNSDDKVEIKQYKACLKAIAAIDKSATLANDIKTAAKITKSLAKAFTNDFSVASAQVSLASVTFSNNLQTLVTGTFSNLADEVQAALDDLQTAIDGLPAGSAKAAAQALRDAAQTLVNSGDSDLLNFAKSLVTAVKDVIKANKVVAKGSGGGGGGGNGINCQVNGTTYSVPTGAYTYSGMDFGAAGVNPTTLKSVSLIALGVTGPGDYPLSAGSYVWDLQSTVQFAGNINGTIHIATLNGSSASGTFSFTATQTIPVFDTNNVANVTQGTFNVPIAP